MYNYRLGETPYFCERKSKIKFKKRDMETIKLSNGVEMPLLGYGVFLVSPQECGSAMQVKRRPAKHTILSYFRIGFSALYRISQTIFIHFIVI